MSRKLDPGTETDSKTKENNRVMVMMINNEEGFPQVKTECLSEEEGSASPNITKSQEPPSKFRKTDREHQVEILDVSTGQGSHHDAIDQELKRKEKSATSSYSQNSNSDTIDIRHGEEVDGQQSAKIAVKSEPNVSTENDPDNNVDASRDVTDLHKSLPTSGSVFPNQQSLEKVYKSHTGDLYTCDICDYSCALKVNMIRHKKIQHAAEKPYSCDSCGYACEDLPSLNAHRVIHAGEKRLSCDLCDYTCSVTSALNQHRKRHTGEKPYSCDLCEYTCTFPWDLKKHKISHSGEKPYSCEHCDYTCARPYDLKRHNRKHTGEKPYACDSCSYTSAHWSTLIAHRRMHTGEKPFSCDLCDYKCAHMSSLTAHRRTHTGEKPFSCDLCDYTCARLNHLKQHQRRHTGKKNQIAVGKLCSTADLKKQKRQDSADTSE